MENAPKTPERKEVIQYPEIAAEIVRMAEEDQQMRKSGEWNQVVDAQNTERMKVIIEKIGWPTKSKVGEFASGRAWLLVQHADHDLEFQKYCLELMKAQESGEIKQANIGYLEDRVRVHENVLQLYGTQFYTDEKGEYGPRPIEDIEHLDERRESMQMGSFKEYKELMFRLHQEGK